MFNWLKGWLLSSEEKQLLSEARSLYGPNNYWGPALFDGTVVDGQRLHTNNPYDILSYAPAHSAINLISGDLANLRLLPVSDPAWPTGAPDDDSKIVTNEEGRRLAALLDRMPEPGYSAHRWWRAVWTQFLVHNQAFIEITDEGWLHLLPPYDQTTWLGWQNDAYANPEWNMYETTDRGVRRRLFPSEVIHFEGMSLGQSEHPLDTSQLSSKSTWLGLAAEEFNSQFYNRGGQKSGFLLLPHKSQKGARERLEKEVEQKRTLRNAFKSVVLRDGANFVDNQVTPADAETDELRERQAGDAARFYKVPPSYVGLPQNTSYGSLVEERKAYLFSTLRPHLRMAEDELELKLLTPRQRELGSIYLRHDTRPLIPMEQTPDTQPRPSVDEPQTEEVEQ